MNVTLHELKTFDHNLVHGQFELYEMLVKMMEKEIQLAEVDTLISTKGGCALFGEQRASKISEALQRMQKVVFQSRKFIMLMIEDSWFKLQFFFFLQQRRNQSE